MEISLVIRRRLEEMGLEQRDLARAAQVTESYISQLLTRQPTPFSTSKCRTSTTSRPARTAAGEEWRAGFGGMCASSTFMQT